MKTDIKSTILENYSKYSDVDLKNKFKLSFYFIRAFAKRYNLKKDVDLTLEVKIKEIKRIKESGVR